jgi:hypothetical protein
MSAPCPISTRQCSKWHRYSITSSARARKDSRMVSPSALAGSARHHAESVDASRLLRSRDIRSKQLHCRGTSDERDELAPPHSSFSDGDHTLASFGARSAVHHSKISCPISPSGHERRFAPSDPRPLYPRQRPNCGHRARSQKGQ